jgi:hypothetical protein
MVLLLLLIESLINERGHDTELGEPLSKLGNARRASNKVKEEDAVFGDTSGNQGLHSKGCRTA